MAAAAVSLACPLRRSSRLAHAHAHSHTTPPRQHHHLKHHRHHQPRTQPDPEPDPDSSSSDPENELTPRALRALKRQRLALDVDGLPLAARVRPRKRRKENLDHTSVDDTRHSHSQGPRKATAELTKRPSSPSTPLTPKRTHSTDNASGDDATQIPAPPSLSIPEARIDGAGPSISISPTEDRPSSVTYSDPSLTAAFNDEPSILSRRDDTPSARDSTESLNKNSKPTSSISVDTTTTSPPLSPIRALSRASSPSDQEPLTPLTPLTSESESSLSLPGHDRHTSPPLLSPSPPHDPSAHQVHPDPSQSSVPADAAFNPPSPQQTLVLDPTPTPATPPPPLSLDPALDTLIPFDSLPRQFESDMSLHLDPPPPAHTLSPPQLPQPGQEQFPPSPLQQTQLPYVPPSPVLNRDREVNIWKLACQERVDYLLRRYGTDYIKALVASEASSVSAKTRSSWSSSNTGSPPPDVGFSTTFAHTPSLTRFRLYTPASYTYNSGSWGSTSPPESVKKGWNSDGECEDPEEDWGVDDGEWADGDIDMEDDDDDDYDDDDDLGDGQGDGEGNVGVADALKENEDVKTGVEMEVDGDMELGPEQTDEKENEVHSVAEQPSSTKLNAATPTEGSPPDAPSPSVVSPSSQPTTPSRNTSAPPIPLTPPHRPSLPSLSSLHVPLLSEPPRAFMGRGTPPDRRRLVEWSGCGRFGANALGMGPPLYLSPVPQRHSNNDVHAGMVSMSDPSIHSLAPHQHHHHHQQQGEWTSFLYAMLEGDGVHVGSTGQSSEASWYELGLGTVSVPVPAPSPELGMPLSHSSAPVNVSMSTELVAEEGSSSTLRFALG